MDELMKKYADRLQKMYDDRTAGDYSMLGVLSEFLEEIVDSCGKSEEMHRKHQTYHHKEK